MKININKQEEKQHTLKDVKSGEVFYSGGQYWISAWNLSNANAVRLNDGCAGWFQDGDKVTLVKAVLEIYPNESP